MKPVSRTTHGSATAAPHVHNGIAVTDDAEHEKEVQIMLRPTTITIDRLFAAADMLLAAMTSTEGIHSLIETAPTRPARRRPEAMEPFTQPELLEAMSMLTRMGYLENRPHPGVR